MGELCIVFAGAKITLLPGDSVEGVLANVPDNCASDSDINYTKQMFKKGKKNILDCGGFTIFIYEINMKEFISDPGQPIIKTDNMLNLAPIHVIQAALFLKPYIVMALDYPINFADGIAGKNLEFTKKLGFQIKWAWECAELKEKYCLESMLFLPVQAFNINQFKWYWKHVKDINPDGLSLPVRHLTLKEVALFLIYFYQIGIKRVHLLGSTQPLLIILSAFFGYHFFDWISLDATTWQQSARNKKFHNPHDLSVEYLGNTLMDSNIQNDCPCIYCQGKSFLDLNDLEDTEKTYALGWHNIKATENFGKQVFNHCQNVQTLRAYLNRKIQSKQKSEVEGLCNIVSIFETFPDLPIENLYDLINSL
jgi:queuine/archaeosine tRNA-ribosyltransferase